MFICEVIRASLKDVLENTRTIGFTKVHLIQLTYLKLNKLKQGVKTRKSQTYQG